MRSVRVSLAAKISALHVPRNILTGADTNVEHKPVNQKTRRVAVILRKICKDLKNFKGIYSKHQIVIT